MHFVRKAQYAGGFKVHQTFEDGSDMCPEFLYEIAVSVKDAGSVA